MRPSLNRLLQAFRPAPAHLEAGRPVDWSVVGIAFKDPRRPARELLRRCTGFLRV